MPWIMTGDSCPIAFADRTTVGANLGEGGASCHLRGLKAIPIALQAVPTSIFTHATLFTASLQRPAISR